MTHRQLSKLGGESLRKFFRALASLEFLRFLAMGSIAAAANFGTGFAFRRHAGTFAYSYEISIMVGFAIGTLVSFVVNKFVTFGVHDQGAHLQFIKFLMIAVLSVLLSGIVGWAMLAALSLMPFLSGIASLPTLGHIGTIGVMTMFNFPMMKWVAFRKLGLLSRLKHLLQRRGSRPPQP